MQHFYNLLKLLKASFRDLTPMHISYIVFSTSSFTNYSRKLVIAGVGLESKNLPIVIVRQIKPQLLRFQILIYAYLA